ncbi:hypothetical protein [Microcoleus sp. bin38.metabat.b11b12b14.051]|uniref:hypothetical protein n=1 Tax=Microcoleus sp. bin38.metabat.b11b12b14.051 TaxID=2742709 RepID=UPI0025D4E9F2|nr:hypothetical protein [Microcoleus sp. bin38.metabat.b11b12b14.051]
MNNLDSLTTHQKRAIFATAMALHHACYLLSKFTTSSPERLLSAISNYVCPGVMALPEDLVDEVLLKLLDPQNVQPNGFSIISWNHKKGCKR